MTRPLAIAPAVPPFRRPVGEYDLERIRNDFPILRTTVRGKPLVYLDNAATSQKPQSVIDAVTRYYTAENANVHRGLHYLSERATAAFDAARERARAFLGARLPEEIVFVRGTTEAINLVAQSWGRTVLKPGDEILLSVMEHHSNIVPWQLVAEQTGARIRVIPMNDRGELLLDEFEKLLTERTRMLGLVQLSNALGTINPVREMIRAAKARGAVTLVDGAQSAPHLKVDVQELGCDFFACSGHKLLGPTGIGVLYGRAELLEQMPPWQGGGDMIRTVTFEKTTYAAPPTRFEAGTPHIEGVMGLGAAFEYLETIGLDAIRDHEEDLLRYATERVAEVKGLRLIGTAAAKASVLSFVIEGVHPHDVGQVLDAEGIAIRAGHHCAQPVMQRLGVPATVRASFGPYNTRDEVDLLIRALHRVREIFS